MRGMVTTWKFLLRTPAGFIEAGIYQAHTKGEVRKLVKEELKLSDGLPPGCRIDSIGRAKTPKSFQAPGRKLA